MRGCDFTFDIVSICIEVAEAAIPTGTIFVPGVVDIVPLLFDI